MYLLPETDNFPIVMPPGLDKQLILTGGLTRSGEHIWTGRNHRGRLTVDLDEPARVFVVDSLPRSAPKNAGWTPAEPADMDALLGFRWYAGANFKMALLFMRRALEVKPGRTLPLPAWLEPFNR